MKVLEVGKAAAISVPVPMYSCFDLTDRSIFISNISFIGQLIYVKILCVI